MNFVFRVDSSIEIGHGHLMRCLVLAQELKLHGASIHFVCRDNSGSAHGLIAEAGYSLYLLDGKRITVKSMRHVDWLGCTQVEDAKDFNRILATINKCHVIVDHYALDIEWESRIICESLSVIDDLADRPHKCCRLIDQSLVRTKEDYSSLVLGDFRFFGGASILLRREFREAECWSDSCNKSIMLCMGGADPLGVTIRITKALVEWLNRSPKQELVKRLDVVVGQAFDAQEDLDRSLADLACDIVLHRGSRDVSTLMTNADLCILSCGTMILEACALGVPAIGVALAENQKDTASFLAERKAIVLLDIEKIKGALGLHVERLLQGRDNLSVLSQSAKNMVDKNSTYSIARVLIDEC
ncbi:UDP-2,4-diacetamido-2,4,6-trideoxy-beta-L-altropyranose hydrolase [Pseudomonas stutzeri]|uniref:UDP-2,4-diacetamido-2,4, 6-trideoxy-beta-L-altropyranose hydrolase n=1 Tax=Stutzerimonas stutzeri TaxID=316 RepID=UPI00190B215E|nr:UDP-2,4-diacetamido-2,4,6-trideoxy-beta-L-altropyranose hydrolase [Stutzerimonas stutzeri]MBK3866154.1 UDP-2,4-diacetamido-2,4,6-trideoxy-beta-L-altropyranose hydrolase [Stutzerimonas stutzeri]